MTGNAPSILCSSCHGGYAGTSANGYWPDGVNAIDNGVEDNSGAHQKHITALALAKYGETLARITSYNVCYTKLLRVELVDAQKLSGQVSEMEQRQGQVQSTVSKRSFFMSRSLVLFGLGLMMLLTLPSHVLAASTLHYFDCKNCHKAGMAIGAMGATNTCLQCHANSAIFTDSTPAPAEWYDGVPGGRFNAADLNDLFGAATSYNFV